MPACGSMKKSIAPLCPGSGSACVACRGDRCCFKSVVQECLLPRLEISELVDDFLQRLMDSLERLLRLLVRLCRMIPYRGQCFLQRHEFRRWSTRLGFFALDKFRRHAPGCVLGDAMRIVAMVLERPE